MKKQTSKNLCEEALEVWQQSIILEETVTWQAKEVEEISVKYTNEEVEKMDWEEKEKYIRTVEELYGRFQQSVKELEELDRRYLALREKVKEKYGKEIMSFIDGKMSTRISPEDEIDMS